MEELIKRLDKIETVSDDGADFDSQQTIDEAIKYLKQLTEIRKIIDEFNDAPDVHHGRGNTNDLALTCFERILDFFKE